VVAKAMLHPVGDGPIGKERRPAPPHGVEQRLLAPYVEEGVLLPGERGGGQVLGRGARANRVGVLRTEIPPRFTMQLAGFGSKTRINARNLLKKRDEPLK
jgi:hypothetical protein